MPKKTQPVDITQEFLKNPQTSATKDQPKDEESTIKSYRILRTDN